MEIASILHKVPAEEYGEHYRAHVLEQYKVYVEMADRVSQRRDSANKYFLSVNAALVGLVTLCGARGGQHNWLLGCLLVPLSGLILCIAWMLAIRSYQGLNRAKFEIIHAIEGELPLAGYDAEWAALTGGKQLRRHLPLTAVERLIPVMFALVYAGLLVCGWG